MRARSVWAVAAGAVVIVAVTTAVDVVLHRLGAYPPWGQPIDDAQALLGTSYRVVIGIAGAWLTARLAPDRPLGHALVLGYIGTVLGLVGVVATWNKELGPAWYSIAHVVLAIPEAWTGGKIHEVQSRKRGVKTG